MSNSTKNNYSIAIIDPVGVKAGMNYYNISLLSNMSNQGVKTYVFSNFTHVENNENIKYYLYFKSHTNSNSIAKFHHFIKAFIKSAKQCRKSNINLVIIHIFSANFINVLMLKILRFYNLKILIIVHDITSLNNDDSQKRRNIICNKLSDLIVVQNKHSYDSLIEKSKIKYPNKIHVIKHGGYIDFINQNITKDEARMKLGLEKNDKFILFFGQIKKVKGLDILLHAMQYVEEDVKLIIAGKSWKDEFTKYDKIINKYNLQNRIHKINKFIDDTQRDLLFHASDISIIPYKIVYQSGVLLMSMSYGLPVIASDLPAIKEVISDGKNGLLFKTENIKDLADKVNFLFSNKELYLKIKNNSINTINSEYSWKEIAKKYTEILKK